MFAEVGTVTIGDRIRKARKRKGLTQETMARMMGIANTTLTGYEKNNRDPKSDKLALIAQICDTTVDFLLGQTDKMDRPTSSDILYISRPSGDLTTDELRKELHDMIDQMEDEDLRLLQSMTIRMRRE